MKQHFVFQMIHSCSFLIAQLSIEMVVLNFSFLTSIDWWNLAKISIMFSWLGLSGVRMISILKDICLVFNCCILWLQHRLSLLSTTNNILGVFLFTWLFQRHVSFVLCCCSFMITIIDSLLQIIIGVVCWFHLSFVSFV